MWTMQECKALHLLRAWNLSVNHPAQTSQAEYGDMGLREDNQHDMTENLDCCKALGKRAEQEERRCEEENEDCSTLQHMEPLKG